MPLIKREKMSAQAERVAASFTMRNTSPAFQEEQALDYIRENKAHFAADASDFLDHCKFGQNS